MAKFLQKNLTSNGVEFVLGNGKALSTDLKALPKDMVHQLALHGLSQKVGDCAASCSKNEEFTRALEQMTETWENLIAGKWRADGGSGSNLLFEAVAAVKGYTIEQVREALKDADEEKLKAIRGNAAVKAKMAAIQAERLAAKADEADDDLDI